MYEFLCPVCGPIEKLMKFKDNKQKEVTCDCGKTATKMVRYLGDTE
jgi:putative FmdB family regulatory protein